MEALSALADPTRRRIVELLSQGELSAGDITRRFEISAPAVSQHLGVLKKAQLVRARADAQRRIYSLDPRGWSDLQGWLDGVRRFWGPRLDALERALRAEATKEDDS